MAHVLDWRNAVLQLNPNGGWDIVVDSSIHRDWQALVDGRPVEVEFRGQRFDAYVIHIRPVGRTTYRPAPGSNMSFLNPTFPSTNTDEDLLRAIALRYGNIPVRLTVGSDTVGFELIVMIHLDDQLVGPWPVIPTLPPAPIIERISMRDLAVAGGPTEAFKLIEERVLAALYPYVEHEDEEECD